MKKLLRSRSFWACVFILLSYWGISQVTPFFERIEVLNALLFGVGMAIVVAYGIEAVKAIYNDNITFHEQLIIGIACGFLSRGIEAFWRLIWRAAGEPLWMQRVDLVGFFLWLSIIAGVLHLTSPRTIHGEIPPPFLVILGSFIGLGAALLAIAIIVLD